MPARSLRAALVNNLQEHTSIHWHGVRVPNAMDGVPYVTQMPVLPREQFTYAFAPPDPGTFFFHPHCNTVAQLGRGLAGVLVVEGDEQEPFDDDVVLVLKDWRVAKNGSFLPFLTVEGAARSGSFGTLRTVNGKVAPRIAVPAGANIRVRLVNADSTRVGDLGIGGAMASVIAIDGNAIAPFALETWRLGPAMRLDLALRTPDDGGEITLTDYFAARADHARDPRCGRATTAHEFIRSRTAESSQFSGTRSRERAEPSIAALRNRGCVDLSRACADRPSRRAQDRHDGCVLRHAAHALGSGWKDLAASRPPAACRRRS